MERKDTRHYNGAGFVGVGLKPIVENAYRYQFSEVRIPNHNGVVVRTRTMFNCVEHPISELFVRDRVRLVLLHPTLERMAGVHAPSALHLGQFRCDEGVELLY